MQTCTSQLPDLVLTEHEFIVPLDHAQPGGEQISVFRARLWHRGRKTPNCPG